MVRSLRIALLSISGVALFSAAGQDTPLTVDQIVAKHTQALGGLEKLRAIHSLTITGKAVLMNGQVQAPVVMKVKRPTSMRLEMSIQGQNFIQAFDGRTSWMINPLAGINDPQKSSEEDTRAARDDADFIEGSLVDYKAKGNTVELVGPEDVDGTPAYKLKVTKSGGSIEYEYLDSKTFLQIKSTGKRKQQGQEFEYESFPSDYKPVDGVMMAYGLRQKMNGETMMQLTVEKIEPNTAIDDSVFQMPEKPKEDKK